MDFSKEENEDQMEMMLMQVGKHLPDFSSSYISINNSSTINGCFQTHQPNPTLPVSSSEGAGDTSLPLAGGGKRASMAAMREMIFRIAAMQPVHIDPESVKPPKRRNVKISTDPQSVAARHRRERISERIRILQRLVPGGTKMDTASMLDEAILYVKFLKNQVQSLEQVSTSRVGTPEAGVPMGSFFPVPNVEHPSSYPDPSSV